MSREDGGSAARSAGPATSPHPNSMTAWALVVGVLLLSLVLSGTWRGRLPLSSAMIYLICGVLLGPGALGMVAPDPVHDAALLEVACEVALLISLFSVGLDLGVPMMDRRWSLPALLAVVSMACTIAMITAVGYLWLELPLGAAVLLGAILAPTDPVLASGLHAHPGGQPDKVGFALAGEGGLNDGMAYPFVMLGLTLLEHPGGQVAWARWIWADLAWSPIAGVVIGGVLGAATGRLIVYLRSRHRQAVGLDMFLGLGLIALSYGLARLASASTFLAVLATGLALRRVAEMPSNQTRPLGLATSAAGHGYVSLATHPEHASATMRDSVQLFNGQIEKLAELILVVAVGAMLARTAVIASLWWFIPATLLIIRPVSVLPVLFGQRLKLAQGGLMAWFGIRGIGSVYYLALILHSGIDALASATLTSLTLWTVTASIVVHGLTARPLMRQYGN